MGLFKWRKKEKQQTADMPRYLYDSTEIRELDRFICDAFGTYENVFHEIVSPDVHLDVCIVNPAEEAPFYKLVTMGAGAYRMNVPEEFREYFPGYAEYVICLPADWNISSSDETDYWPVRLLKDTARLPVRNDTWLAYGHTVQSDEEGSPYASSTGFSSVVLDFAESRTGDSRVMLSSGKEICFYGIIPLYPEELRFKMENDAEALFKKMNEKGIRYTVLDINRKSACD